MTNIVEIATEKCTLNPNTCQVSFCGWPNRCDGDTAELSDDESKALHQRCLTFLADLNGQFLMGKSMAEKNMRDRSLVLQGLLYAYIKTH
jgi:hypothetical protein